MFDIKSYRNKQNLYILIQRSNQRFNQSSAVSVSYFICSCIKIKHVVISNVIVII